MYKIDRLNLFPSILSIRVWGSGGINFYIGEHLEQSYDSLISLNKDLELILEGKKVINV